QIPPPWDYAKGQTIPGPFEDPCTMRDPVQLQAACPWIKRDRFDRSTIRRTDSSCGRPAVHGRRDEMQLRFAPAVMRRREITKSEARKTKRHVSLQGWLKDKLQRELHEMRIT